MYEPPLTAEELCVYGLEVLKLNIEIWYCKRILRFLKYSYHSWVSENIKQIC